MSFVVDPWLYKRYGARKKAGGRPKDQMSWTTYEAKAGRLHLTVERHIGTWGLPETVTWVLNVKWVGRA